MVMAVTMIGHCENLANVAHLQSSLESHGDSRNDKNKEQGNDEENISPEETVENDYRQE